MDMTEAIVFQQILPPATMVPACGLLLLSTSARMNMALSRIRAFHSERLSVWKMDAKPDTREDAVRELRLEGLEYQTHRLLRRAQLLRLTMLQLFVAVSCNLLAVIGLAGSFAIEDSAGTLHSASVGAFIFGIVVMLSAMVTSFLEVIRITETVRYEHRRIETICASDLPVANIASTDPPNDGSGL